MPELRRIFAGNDGPATLAAVRELDDLSGLVDLGRAALEAGEPQVALNAYMTGTAVASERGDLPALVALGIRYAQLEVDAATAAYVAGSVYDAALVLVAQGRLDLMDELISAATRAASYEAEHGEKDRALERLSAARELAFRSGAANARGWASTHLARVHMVSGGDAAAALPYALDAAEVVSARADDDIEPPPAELVTSMLTRLAQAFYYHDEDHPRALAAAQAARALAPDEVPAIQIEAYALMRQERAEEALACYEQLERIEPDEPQHARNRALCLSALNRPDEAAEALLAVERHGLADARSGLDLAQAYMNIQRHEDALRVLLATRDLAREEAEQQTETHASTSAEDYSRNMPAHDIVDIASSAIVNVALALGRTDVALAAADDMTQAEDAPTRATGWRVRAEILTDVRRHDEALTAWDEALRANPEHVYLAIGRAGTLTRLERYAEAVSALAAVADDHEHAETIADLLTTLLERLPDDPAARRALGLAHFAAWRPSLAIGHLDDAVEHFADDPHVRRIRGLTQILWSPKDEEAEWNEGFGPRRIVGAAIDLAIAARLEPDEPAHRESLLWLIDRACAAPFLHEALADEEAVTAIVPLVVDALDRRDDAVALSEQRRWDEAVAIYHELQGQLRAAGLPVWEARIDLHLADNYLRLYDLQASLDHIERAKQVVLRSTRPMTKTLDAQVAQAEERSEREGAEQPAFVELDYMGVVMLGSRSIPERVTLLEAQAYVRLGEDAKAREVIGDPGEFVDSFTDNPTVDLFQVVQAVVVMLREVRDYDAAIALLPRFAELARDDAQRINQLMTSALVHSASGNIREGLSQLEAAHELAADRPQDRVHIEINLASSLQALGMLDEAVEVIEHIDRSYLTGRGILQLHSLTALVMRDLRRFDRAEAEALAAIELADRTRMGLRGLESRIAWQGDEELLFAIATLSALDGGDPSRALTLAEQGRSRAFAEQLAAGHLPTPEAARGDLELEARIERRIASLQRIDRSLQEAGPAFVDHESINRLRELVPALELLTEDGRAIDPAKLATAHDEAGEALRRTRARLDALREEFSPSRQVPVLTAAELQAVLAP